MPTAKPVPGYDDRYRPWSLRPATDQSPDPLSSAGQPSVQIGPAWRRNALESGMVVQVASNYATLGSAAKHGWTPTRNVFPPADQDPRIPAYNHLAPTLWHLRVTTPTELAAFTASHQNVNLSQPVTYTPPGLATLLRTGGV